MGWIYLGLSIAASTLMISFFKEIDNRQLRLTVVVSINYLFSALVGWIFTPSSPTITEAFDSGVWQLAIVTGLFFIVNFILMGITTKEGGLNFTALMFRVSLIIPVLFSAFWYDEPITWLNIVGIILALAAIYLITRKEKEDVTSKKPLLMAAAGFALLISAGTVDSSFKVFSREFSGIPDQIFATFAFGTAFILSLIPLGFHFKKEGFQLRLKDVIGGLVLGAFNFLGFLFFVKALPYFNGGIVFPINSISSLMGATLIAILFYREKYNLRNYIGLGMAILAILLLLVA